MLLVHPRCSCASRFATDDNAKLQEAKMQLVMSAGISVFLHMQFGYTQPLLLMGARTPTNCAESTTPHPRVATGRGRSRAIITP